MYSQDSTEEKQTPNHWYVSKAGFWRPHPHLVLEQTFHYEQANVFLDQYMVLDQDGSSATYKIWDHYYSREAITRLMQEWGYQVMDIWSDLTGQPYEEHTKCLGAACKKRDV